MQQKFFSWSKSAKKWTKRRRTLKTVARVYSVCPQYTELFCIRLLVYAVKGPTSFLSLRTSDSGEVFDTFCEAARVQTFFSA